MSAEETPAQPVTYLVAHTTQFSYSRPVSVSHHVARVMPRECPGQECLQHELQIDPPAAIVRPHRDYYGNGVAFFIMERAHRE